VLAMRPVSPSAAVQTDLALPESSPVTEAPKMESPHVPEHLQPEGHRGVLRIPAVLFEEGSSVLRSVYLPYLDEVVLLIARYPQAKVYVEGHADSEGAPLQEVRLSQDRADVVLRYLVEKKRLSSIYLYARGHGESAPQDNGTTEKAHANNRRVEIVILTQ